MDNRQSMRLAYDYLFYKIPMSKSGDNLKDPYSCSKEGLLGKYGRQYGISYQDIKQELNSLGIDTEGKWGGKDLGACKGYIDRVSYDDLLDFNESGEYDIKDYIRNIANDPNFYKNKNTWFNQPSQEDFITIPVSTSSSYNYQPQQDDYSYNTDYDTDYDTDSVSDYSTYDVTPSRSYRAPSRSHGSSSKSASIADFIIGIIVIIVIVKIISAIGGFVGNTTSNIKNFVSSDYKMESFKYKDRQFVGDRKFNRPNGVCYSYGLSSSSEWVLGEYKSGKLNGYAVVKGSKSGTSYVDIGKINKKYKLKGYGIHVTDKATYIGKFKNGKPSGYGYMVDSSGYHIVKFKHIKGVDYSDSVKIIATKSGSRWVKPNGKELKISNDKYKGMELGDKGEVTIGKVTFKVSQSYGKYCVSDLTLSGSESGATYDTRLSSNSEGIDMHCSSNGSVNCTYAYKTKAGLFVYSYSTK